MFRTLRRDHIALLPRDPERGYAFWQLQPSTEAHARAQSVGAGKAHLACRVSTVVPAGPDAPHHYRMMACVALFTLDDSQPGGRFFDFAGPDRLHRAELGLLLGDQSFVPIVRSEVVRAPRQRPGQEAARFVRVYPGAEGLEVFEEHGDQPARRLFSSGLAPRVSSHTRPTREL